MTRNIILKGQMGKLFGEKHRLNCKTVQEAMHAIDVMKGGLRRYLMECTDQNILFTVQKGKQVKEYTKENMEKHFIGYDTLNNNLGDDDIIITPVPAGAGFLDDLGDKFSSWFKVILGVLLIVASFMIPGLGPAAAGMLASIGIQLALQGIVELLTPDPDNNQEEKSSLFNGPVNTTKTGVPVPIAYGQVEVGGVVTNFSFTRARIENANGYSKSGFDYTWNV